jgi:hypothetical protein
MRERAREERWVGSLPLWLMARIGSSPASQRRDVGFTMFNASSKSQQF